MKLLPHFKKGERCKGVGRMVQVKIVWGGKERGRCHYLCIYGVGSLTFPPDFLISCISPWFSHPSPAHQSGIWYTGKCQSLGRITHLHSICKIAASLNYSVWASIGSHRLLMNWWRSSVHRRQTKFWLFRDSFWSMGTGCSWFESLGTRLTSSIFDWMTLVAKWSTMTSWAYIILMSTPGIFWDLQPEIFVPKNPFSNGTNLERP